MLSLRFWQKIYLYTLALFLLCLNGGVFAVCAINRTQSTNAMHDQLKMRQQIIVTQIANDINEIQSSRPYAIESVHKAALAYSQREGFIARLYLDDKIIESDMPSDYVSSKEMINAGNRLSYIQSISGRKHFIMTTVLPLPLNNYKIEIAADISQSEAQWDKTVSIFTALCLMVSLVLAVTLYLALGRLSRPLITLAHTAEEFANGNHAARFITPHTNDEIALLARSFNRLAIQTENDLHALGEAAVEKQNLVDAMSHEMRTPLTAIHGYAEYIQRASLSQEEMYEATSYIMSESNRLEQVANQLLNLAVLRGEPLNKESVDLLELMRRTYRTVLPKAGKRGVKVIMSKPPNYNVMGDEALLESLLVNIIDNGVKACDEGGNVRVEAQHFNGNIVFTIADTGRGMTAEQLERIGQPFYRADKARSRVEGGAGLGVSLCYQIVQSHCGTLQYKSSPKKGTVATIVLLAGEK